jgi:hypothetical protein
MKINTSERQGKCECDPRIKRKKQKSRFKEPFFLHVMSRKLRNISIPKDFPLGIPTTTRQIKLSKQRIDWKRA